MSEMWNSALGNLLMQSQYDLRVSRCFKRLSASSNLILYNRHWMWFMVWCTLLLWVMESADSISSADNFDPMWFICKEVTLCIMICCTQESFLSQLSVPMGSMASLGCLLSPVTYPVISQLWNTCLILSFYSCQFSSIVRATPKSNSVDNVRALQGDATVLEKAIKLWWERDNNRTLVDEGGSSHNRWWES